MVCLLERKEVWTGAQTWSNGRPRINVNDDVIKLFLVYLPNLVTLSCAGKCILGQSGTFSQIRSQIVNVEIYAHETSKKYAEKEGKKSIQLFCAIQITECVMQQI